ncbi:MAG: phosphoribosylglycinamide formyltransferase [Bacteroidales bacterium]|nr:phosphoribosylglycinamide formyltransferase [Bacteroidales bacterium]MBN2821447.1 phosphoribosylglycinamide formyltransferase [Bacteroidales bacterium]
MSNIAIFASGSGSNAQNIIEYFQNSKNTHVKCILCNSLKAFVLERARNLNVNSFVFDRKGFYNENKVLDYLKSQEIDIVVLAGFLWLIPENLIKAYPNKIINIHPALLPKYGGKGMYGMHVHQAVVDNNEQESGITIHYVNERYDEGDIIFQAKCKVDSTDTPDDVARKVHELEYKHFPRVIEQVILKSN